MSQVSTTIIPKDNLEKTIKKIQFSATSKIPTSASEGGYADSWITGLPAQARARFEKYGIDLSKGYPERPLTDDIPIFIEDAVAFRNKEFAYIARGQNADPEKKALLGAAEKVIDLTKHIGTEIVGLQLSQLTDQQKDELALLIAERVVVFFRDQDLDPKVQLELGKFWGNVEVHPQAFHVPTLPGVSVIWQDLAIRNKVLDINFKNSNSGTAFWHTDLTHENQPPGITHLHNDTIPIVGGDTVWASGYAAYDKLSPALQEFLDGKTAIYASAHSYINPVNPLKGRVHIEREHPIVRTHPVTGWKSLFVNRKYTKRIVGLEKGESDVILDYLFDVFEKNLDIQVRFNWKPTRPGFGTSAIWDNRISQHYAIWDHEGKDARHGTRVSSLAEVPFFNPESKSQREALGLK